MDEGGRDGVSAGSDASPAGGRGKRGARAKPTPTQRAYLERGLGQPGGKLPLFTHEGLEISTKTITSCIDHGWAARWFDNPTAPDWLVCRLTAEGYLALGATPPAAAGEHG